MPHVLQLISVNWGVDWCRIYSLGREIVLTIMQGVHILCSVRSQEDVHLSSSEDIVQVVLFSFCHLCAAVRALLLTFGVYSEWSIGFNRFLTSRVA